jgi:hypothetical protein
LRSPAWFGGADKVGFFHRSWTKSEASRPTLDGRPIMGICNTWSELTRCNAGLREVATLDRWLADRNAPYLHSALG